MITIKGRLALAILLSFLLFGLSSVASAEIKGIYVTQPIFEDDTYLKYLIARSKKAGINAFIVDLDLPSKHYEKNMQLLKESGINYVARITIYPGGARPDQILNQAYWEKKYKLVLTAISYGAQQIQLDYIRYNTHSGSSPERAKNVYKVIQWFKERLAKQNIPLEIDVFGVSSFGEETHIGQNIKLFSNSVDMFCPMVYPSHFEPFRLHAMTPYKTVYNALEAMKSQFANQQINFKIVPYIELSNYRFDFTQAERLDYIYAQIQATRNAGADGWYAWSPHNLYDNLFKVLEMHQTK